MKGKFIQFTLGIFVGAALFSGGAALATGIVAEPSWQNIYVDGEQVSMTAYNINGHNYVKLRDIGQEVGFNVYWQNGVQIDTDAPYTGEAPAAAAATSEVRVSSYKGNTLAAGDRSGLIIGPSGPDYTVISSNPAAADVENISGFWVVAAKSSGTALITVIAPDGGTGSLTITVEASETEQSRAETNSTCMDPTVDLTANMEIRQEMIRLINQVRRENGVGELTVNQALMNAAQDCSAQGFTDHNDYEAYCSLAYGYPYGFADNLTWFGGSEYLANIAQTAVTNWKESSGHFQAMIDPMCDCIGVGVTVKKGIAYCYMFAGDPHSHNAYE